MRGSWRPNRTATYWPFTQLAITAFLSHSPGLLNGGHGGPLCWVLAFPTASCHQRVWSPNWFDLQLTDFLSSPSYIIVKRPLLLVGVTIALIQHIHGQGYNSDIPRPDAPVIYTGAFPILTARPGRWSIYNIWMKNNRIHNFPNNISVMWNANSLVQDLNSGHPVNFLWWLLLHHNYLLCLTFHSAHKKRNEISSNSSQYLCSRNIN